MFSDEHLIKARMSSGNSLFVNPFDTDVMLSGDSPHFEAHVSPVHDNTFPMLLKLIHGSVIDSGIPDNNFDNDNISANSDSSLFPTMSGVAEKAAKESGNRLDRKQMIVYETICSTFLLGLVNEGNDETTLLGRYFSQALQRKETRKSCEPADDNSTPSDFDANNSSLSSISSSDDMSTSEFSSSFINEEHEKQSESSMSHRTSIADDSTQRSFNSGVTFSYDDGSSTTSTSFSMNAMKDIDNPSVEMNTVVNLLSALGGREQLVMFLTGPAGAGKTTAVKLAQRFCFEFCNAVGILWNDTTFLFTAYTGSAASFFGGVTICKAAFLLKKKAALNQDEIDKWKDVRILVIDEISFMQDSEILKLDRRLKECRNRNKAFGGYSIIFAGDFRQLEPSRASPSDLLFSRECSGH